MYDFGLGTQPAAAEIPRGPGHVLSKGRIAHTRATIGPFMELLKGGSDDAKVEELTLQKCHMVA